MAKALGKLCPMGHDHDGSGMSLRYIHKKHGTPTSSCVECRRLSSAKNREGQMKARRRLASQQKRFDNKYTGNPCERGHTDRYVADGSCVACETERRRRRAQDPDRIPIERARKKRDNAKRGDRSGERRG
jgi:hypothetical protein